MTEKSKKKDVKEFVVEKTLYYCWVEESDEGTRTAFYKKKEISEDGIYGPWSETEIFEVAPDTYDTWKRWTKDLNVMEIHIAQAREAIKKKSIDELEEALSAIESLVESHA